MTHPTPHHGYTGDLVAVLTSLWWAMDAIGRALPPWSVVPPLLLAAVSGVNAVNTFLNDHHRRRRCVAGPNPLPPDREPSDGLTASRL